MSLVLAGIVVLGLLVFIHELGHFLAAKYFKVRVEVFSLGFGPRLIGFTRGETDYRIAPIPLGGYVRMSGEMPGDKAVSGDDPGMLTAKPRWQRLIIMLAGPAMNVALAIAVWWALFVHGIQVPELPAGPPLIERFETGSPAEIAGLLPGDRIVKVGDAAIGSFADYQNAMLYAPGKTLRYTVERDGRTQEVDVTVGKDTRFGVGWDGVRIRLHLLVSQVMANEPAAVAGLLAGDRILEIDGRVPVGLEGAVAAVKSSSSPQIKFKIQRGSEELTLMVTPAAGADGKPKIGVAFGYPLKLVKYPPAAALKEAVSEARRNATELFTAINKLLRRDLGMDAVSGPLEIARISRDQMQQGFVPFVQLLAFISLQLGLFNLLPIPVLDGGHILILLFEGALRRDLSPRFKERVLQVGFVLLLTFAATIIFLDAKKFYVASNPETPAPAKHEAPAAPSPR
ncbi:MAG: RIP metalloprotease RseP [Acidobacteriota bacterium]